MSVLQGLCQSCFCRGQIKCNSLPSEQTRPSWPHCILTVAYTIMELRVQLQKLEKVPHALTFVHTLKNEAFWTRMQGHEGRQRFLKHDPRSTLHERKKMIYWISFKLRTGLSKTLLSEKMSQKTSHVWEKILHHTCIEQQFLPAESVLIELQISK